MLSFIHDKDPLGKRKLQEEAEIQLYEKIKENKHNNLKELFLESRSYNEYLQNLAKLRENIDRFFEKVLVMAPDENIKNNRLALLLELTSLFNRFALFSFI